MSAGAAARTPLLALLVLAHGQAIPPGTLVDSVICEDDRAQHYALYLPSDYTPERAWSLLLAFHPSARGTAFVETYRAAAERYGYIVAASNTSRNGSWDETRRAVRAMSRDVGRRFTVDAERVYLTGHSGGGRVAMEVALGSAAIAGVIASSAGFPDAQPRSSVRFPLFLTAGHDDFNYLEVRRLDQRLASPHALVLFDGGHVLPPAAVAQEALEWMELQAMRSGRRPRDAALVNALYESWQRRVAAAATPMERLRALERQVGDFTGLVDVTGARAAIDALRSQAEVRRALQQERAALDAESRMLDETLALEARLSDPSGRAAALAALRMRLDSWARTAAVDTPSPDRSRSRRLLGAIAAGAADRVPDAEYRELVRQIRRSATVPPF
jgi:predicted esterase